MKKTILRYCIYSFILLSIISFVSLNIGNTEFPLFSFNTSFENFDVESSTLPDVEAVKNTLILFREMFSY